MKLLLLFSCVFLQLVQAAAQNLISNPSFEINNGCPNQINQVDKADGWSGWGGTPDYYHNCANATTPGFGIPFNNRGFQVPRTGGAYIGLFTFSDLSANGREYVGRALQQPMVVGQQYFISFWICSVDQLLATHSTDRIGVRFTTAPHSQLNPDTALNNGHVFSNLVVSDSLNWTSVSGSFIADSAYTHMGIGNYFDDATTVLVTGHPTSNYAYYLIDDVCVSADPLFCGVETGLHNLSTGSGLSVYPNPSSGLLKVSGWRAAGTAEIHITAITGQQIEKSTTSTSEASFDVSGWPEGVYVIKVVTGEECRTALFTKSGR